MRENMKRAPKSPTSGKHVLSFALLGLLLAGATFALGLSAGQRMAQTPTVAYENNPLLVSDKKTEALAQVQLQQMQRQQAQPPPALTFQEELIKPIPVVVAAPVPVPKPVSERPVVTEPSVQASARTAMRHESLRDAFLELEQEGKEVSKKEVSKPVAGASEWTLQVSSHRGQEEAERVAARLSGKGYAAYVVAVELGEKGTWHRVRVGQFASKQEAEILADKFVDDMRMAAPLVISLK